MARVSYSKWRADVVARLKRKDISPAHVPPREWSRMFIQGVSVSQAIQAAQVHAYNAQRPAFRIGGRH